MQGFVRLQVFVKTYLVYIKFAIFMANFSSELESLCYESEKSMDELVKKSLFL